jgi:hypothetical protein
MATAVTAVAAGIWSWAVGAPAWAILLIFIGTALLILAILVLVAAWPLSQSDASQHQALIGELSKYAEENASVEILIANQSFRPRQMPSSAYFSLQNGTRRIGSRWID